MSVGGDKKESITKSDHRNRQQWGILDNDRSIDSVIGERVPANIRASSRGKTEGASVIHKEKASKGWKVKANATKYVVVRKGRVIEEDSRILSGRMKSIET